MAVRRIKRVGAFLGPLGIGVLYGFCWIAAMYLDVIQIAIPPVLLLAATAAILLALPVLLIVLVARRRLQRANSAAAIAAVALATFPAIFVSLFPNANGSRSLTIILSLQVFTPVLSLCVVLGFIWTVRAGDSAARRWWDAGTRAALIGAAGMGLVPVALLIANLIVSAHGGYQCSTLGGCMLAAAVFLLSIQALATAAFAGLAFALVGGPVGAWLRIKASATTAL
jgi:hypothetical protein